MPKKIRQPKDTILKPNREPLINVNNVHILIIAVAVVVLCVCIGAGVFAYLFDKNHPNKDNAIVLFTYTETLDEGYAMYDIRETDARRVFTEYNTLEVMDVNEISRWKYLDFNEEIYNSGFFDVMNDYDRNKADDKWQLYIKFADGTRKYIYGTTEDGKENTELDKELLNDIIYRYFGEEINYK